jgi:hypothetical protein
MSEQSTFRRAVVVFVAATFLSGSVSAQPPTVSAVPRNTGPVGIAELHALLDVHMQFQIFDFEAEEKFCLVLGYVHEVDGLGSSQGQHNEVACNLAGPQRLIVVMRPVGDKLRLLFGLHDRDTGAGSTRIVGDLSIPKGLGTAAFFGAEQSIRSDRETMLIRWQHGPNPPHPGQRHHIRIFVRLDENNIGIGSYSKPNDFGQ